MESETIMSEAPAAPPRDVEETQAASAHEEELESEQDRPNVGAIGVMIAVTLLALGGVVFGVSALFRHVIGDEISSKVVLGHPSSELRGAQPAEDARAPEGTAQQP